ncbi:unnamed protein product, partial [marine sediment metagenome]
MSIFGEPESEGQAKTHEVSEVMLGGAILGPGAIPAALIWGAGELFGAISDIFKRD